MKKIMFCLLAVVLMVGLIACAAPAPAPPPTPPPAPAPAPKPETITLSAIGFQFPEFPPVSYLYTLAEEVEKRSRGELIIDVKGGSEVIPIMEQHEALRGGVVDVVWHFYSLWKGMALETQYETISTVEPIEYREQGIHDFWSRIYKEKCGVLYLGSGYGGPRLGTWIMTKPKVEKLADLKGLRIRTFGPQEQAVAALGGTPVTMPVSEAYGALERGVVDGIAWQLDSGAESRLHFSEVTNYVLMPQIAHSDSVVLMNIDSFNRLPEYLQDVLTESMQYLQYYIYYRHYLVLQDEIRLLKDGGVEFIELSPTEAKQMQDTTRDTLHKLMEEQLDSATAQEMFALGY